MTRLSVAALSLALVSSVLLAKSSAQEPKADAPVAAQATPGLKDFKTKVSYTIGLEMAKNFKTSGVEIDPDTFLEGMKDGLAEAKSKLTDAQMVEIKQQLQEQMMVKQKEMTAKAGEKLSKEGADFLAANAKKPGVQQTASGLQYKVIKEGTGASPKATDTVKTHYKGMLINGKTFDSSIDRGQPLSIPLNRVIPGWTEGMQLMKVGGKTELYIPYNLAYGAQGSPPTIPGYSALIFEVELLGIDK